MTAEEVAERAFRELAADALELVERSGRSLDEFRGIPLYDTAKDELFQNLSSFSHARAALEGLPETRRMYGDEGPRLILFFIYALMDDPEAHDFPARAIDRTWSDFKDELARPAWTFRAVANLNYFSRNPVADSAIIARELEAEPWSLGHGVIIMGRSRAALESIGCEDSVIQGLFQEWRGFGISSFVIYADSSVKKTPDNFITVSDGVPEQALNRAVLAMRLVGQGSVSCGQIYIARPSAFRIGSGGRFGLPPTGAYKTPFVLRKESLAEITQLMQRLEILEEGETAGSNLALAFRQFSASYERTTSADTALDLVTTLEALLGSSKSDITYALSMRVAHLLADDEHQRARLFTLTKRWYGVRSRLVHGDPLKPAEIKLLADYEQLRDLVRALLRGFLALRSSQGSKVTYGKRFFEQDLDEAMLDPSRLTPLRAAMELRFQA